MPVLVAGIHAVGPRVSCRQSSNVSAWMAGTSPAMTVRDCGKAREEIGEGMDD